MNTAMVTVYSRGVSVFYDGHGAPQVEVEASADVAGPMTAEQARVMARELMAAADEVDAWETTR